MICWSCQKNVAATSFCSQCAAILPLAGRPDHFSLLGAPQRFTQDLPALERSYKESARAVHPDKFARADVHAKRASTQRTVALNDAWRTLRDPVARAEYLVSLLGIELGAEDGTIRKTEDGQRKMPVPAALLDEVMEAQEALSVALCADNEVAVAGLHNDIQERKARSMSEAAAALDADAPIDAERAAAALVAARYYRRLLESFVTSKEHG